MTTTPVGLNHKTLPLLSIVSSSVNIDPMLPRIENVIIIKIMAVTALSKSFQLKTESYLF